MSSKTAVSVENLNKFYRIGVAVDKSDSAVAALSKFIRSPLSNYKKYRSLYKFNDIDLEAVAAGQTQLPDDVIWAIRNMNFEVPRGQVLGIIGHNGAGKSTLLKILSRITTPTQGRVEIRGRISSLLEVGTGFHNELTGRENTYLNGTILGMSKKEVDRVFDEIVEFSGVEKFLDTPVKRYSTGMKVRLAFAVAAHLEPEILIVDEVLSVGDAEFQRKCMDKMESIGEEGRTILFVSHNMPAVTRMCNRVITIDHGSVVNDGNPQDVVSHYLKSGQGKSSYAEWPDQALAPGGDIVKLRSVSIRDENSDIAESVDIRQACFVEIGFDCIEDGHVLLPSFSLWNEEGTVIFNAVDIDPEWRGRKRPIGRYVARAKIPGNLLTEGTMSINTAVWEWAPRRRTEFVHKDSVTFHVVDNLDGDSARGDYMGNLRGAVRPMLDWSTDFSSS